jgi:cell division protein FtsA
MFEPSSIVVGVEIGTSKICAVVGEVSAEGSFRVLGVGQSESRGVRKGEIKNPSEVSDSLRSALKQAEEMADVEIRSVWLGVTGGHVQAMNNRGYHSIASDDREITEADVQDALRIAKAVNLPAQTTPIHMVRRHFIVDGQMSDNPIGMFGHRLEANVLMIYGNTHRLQNSVGALRSLSLEVEDLAFNGLASSLAVLTPDHKEVGTLVIDFGGGSTDFTVTAGGVTRHAGVLAVGGDHVSQDLASGLKIPLGLAERLKIDYGAAEPDTPPQTSTIHLESRNGLTARTINRVHLQRIMAARLEEIFEIVGQKLAEADVLDWIRGGVVLTGGGARIRGICELVSRVLQLPTEIGRIQCVSGMASTLDQVEFATAIGIAKFGSFRVQTELARRPKWRMWANIFQRS